MNRKNFFGIFSILIFILIPSISLSNTSFGAREVVLKKRAEIGSKQICLQDLVEDTWLKARCRLDHLNCCQWTLESNLKKTLSATEIDSAIQKMDIGGFKVRLVGAAEVAVEQTKRALRKKEIESKLVKMAEAKLGDETVDVKVVKIEIPSPVFVSLQDETAWDIVVPDGIFQRYNSTNPLKIVSIKDGEILGWVKASMSITGEVFVAKRNITPMQALKKSYFELKRADILRYQAAGQTVFRKNQFPEGYRARHTILAGKPLYSGAIEKIPLVRLGDTVTLILRSDNLKISTKGVVQGAAAIGDMVTVQLPRYQRTFRGRLLEGRFVEVWL